MLIFFFLLQIAAAAEQYSGIYPHLAYFNNEGECGTGAVVPWADRLWVVTYAPHSPKGSSDKLYEIDEDLILTIRPESIGGTPANRMIHRESNQLFIGPYAIDAQRRVRVIPYAEMFGRPTGNARHLTDPANKIYYASMEEALYEVDVHTLKVTPVYRDEADKKPGPKADLPGYHGKGLYSGQGRVVYANNGEHGGEAQRNPFVESGVLAEWDGKDWNIVRRNQFTEVTGPGGIYGSSNPESDPIWAMGWDARSLILMVLDQGKWHRFRLPKASHSYDGAHGWNTEWPRIRDIGEEDLLMTMHGMFWKFPRDFSIGKTAGIKPRSTYLKVIGDFCQWNNRIVFGCDDTAKNEFLNKRKAKGKIAGPQSQSNLWFVKPDQLDEFGTVIGRGAVWLNDSVKANSPSDPYLFDGFDRRNVHIICGKQKAEIKIEFDRKGDGKWTEYKTISVNPNSYYWNEFLPDDHAAWVRLTSNIDLTQTTAWFSYSSNPSEADGHDLKFDGLARVGDENVTGGIIRARGDNKRSLQFAAQKPDGTGKVSDIGLYILDEKMQLKRTDDATQLEWVKEHAAIPSRKGVIEIDEASVLYIDDNGQRFRLPKTDTAYDQTGPLGVSRLDREVATERDLFNCHGTFFELPANNAGGFGRVRPVCTHGLRIKDYCSYRGLLVMSGINEDVTEGNRHIIKSDDGKAALWVGAIDDIWDLGKPVGHGGPWMQTTVTAGEVSDPYLMTGYDKKTIHLESTHKTYLSIEIDITGTGQWIRWKSVAMDAGDSVEEVIPRSLGAYWVRIHSTNATTATAQLKYE